MAWETLIIQKVGSQKDWTAYLSCRTIFFLITKLFHHVSPSSWWPPSFFYVCIFSWPSHTRSLATFHSHAVCFQWIWAVFTHHKVCLLISQAQLFQWTWSYPTELRLSWCMPRRLGHLLENMIGDGFWDRALWDHGVTCNLLLRQWQHRAYK